MLAARSMSCDPARADGRAAGAVGLYLAGIRDSGEHTDVEAIDEAETVLRSERIAPVVLRRVLVPRIGAELDVLVTAAAFVRTHSEFRIRYVTCSILSPQV